MLTVKENDRLTRVGPNTPMGESMSLYWQPIAALAEVLSINYREQTVRVCYLDAMGQPELVGPEIWLSGDEVISIDMEPHSEGQT